MDRFGRYSSCKSEINVSFQVKPQKNKCPDKKNKNEDFDDFLTIFLGFLDYFLLILARM